MEEAPVSTISGATQTIGLPTRTRVAADLAPQIPDYRFVKVIGRGAFGTVWLAEETMAGVFRAIKVLHPARTHKPTDRPASAVPRESSDQEQSPTGEGPPVDGPVDPWALPVDDRQRPPSLIDRELAGIHAYQALAKDHPHLVRILKTGLCKAADPSRDGEGTDRSRNADTPGSRPLADARGSDVADSTAARTHPAVYYVMEIADHAGGAQPHHEMDYQPLSLAALLRQKGRLPVGSLVRESLLAPRSCAPGVIECALDLLDAIEHLHRAGLYHRDVKPSNILFVNGVIKLADLGLTASDEADETVGTPGYLPPPPDAGVDDEGGEAVASPPSGRRVRGAGALTGNMPTRASAPQRPDAAPPLAGAPTAKRFGPPDDLYALGKVMYEMLTGLPAASFPEWPADLDPASDLLLPRLRVLVNDLCHPSAERRLSDTRKTRQKLADIQSGPRVLRITRRRAVAALAAVATAFLAGGIGVDRFWAWWKDPFVGWRGAAPFDGSGRESTYDVGGYRYNLQRYHRPRDRCELGGAMTQEAVVWDLQTRLGRAVNDATGAEDDCLIVAGSYQLSTTLNAVTGDARKPVGKFDQLYLLVGYEIDLRMALLYHGQPGPLPGARGRFVWRVPLRDIVFGPDTYPTPIRLILTNALTPVGAEASFGQGRTPWVETVLLGNIKRAPVPAATD